MGKLNKYGYQKLIDENIEALEKYMPKHSLEKKHTIEVLKWSIGEVYGRAKEEFETSDSGLNKHIVSGCCTICNKETASVCEKCLAAHY